MPAESPIPHPNIDVPIAVNVPSSAPAPVRQIASESFLYCSIPSEKQKEGRERSIRAVNSLFMEKPDLRVKETLSQILDFPAIFSFRFGKLFFIR